MFWNISGESINVDSICRVADVSKLKEYKVFANGRVVTVPLQSSDRTLIVYTNGDMNTMKEDYQVVIKQIKDAKLNHLKECNEFLVKNNYPAYKILYGNKP